MQNVWIAAVKDVFYILFINQLFSCEVSKTVNCYTISVLKILKPALSNSQRLMLFTRWVLYPQIILSLSTALRVEDVTVRPALD